MKKYNHHKIISFVNLPIILFAILFSFNSCKIQNIEEEAFYKVNRERNSYQNSYDEKVNKVKGRLLWDFNVARDTIVFPSSPIYYKNTIYFGCSDGKIYSVNSSNGSLKWTFNTGTENKLSTPAISEDIIYFGSSNKYFYAVSLKSKKLIWSFLSDGEIECSPIVFKDKVYFGTSSGTFYALNIKNGKIVWSYEARDPINSSPAIADGMIYFGTYAGAFYESEYDATLFALDAEYGKEIWKFKTNGGNISTPCIWNNTIYFSSDWGELYYDPDYKNIGGFYALDTKSGKEIWKHKLGSYLSSPILINGIIYRGVFGGIIAQDAQNGKVLWSYDTILPRVDGTPAYANGAVFTTDSSGHLYSIDAKTGKEIWKLYLGDGEYNPRGDNPETSTTPIIANDVLYVTLFKHNYSEDFSTLLKSFK
jgi:outer membrane protein assembly factor BamB